MEERYGIVAAVGENAFLSSIMSKKSEIKETSALIEEVLVATQVLDHIFEQRPMTEEVLSEYPEAVREELQKLSRQLFVERFKHTRSYQKNMKILEFIKNKLEKTIGVGQVDQIVSVTFNKLGTSAPYMDDETWFKFLDMVVEDNLRDIIGDVQAEEYNKLWKMELERKLKKYL